MNVICVNYITIKKSFLINLGISCISSWHEPHPRFIFPGVWHFYNWIQRLPNKGAALIKQSYKKRKETVILRTNHINKITISKLLDKISENSKDPIKSVPPILSPSSLPPQLPLLFLSSSPHLPLQTPDGYFCGKVNISAKKLQEGAKHFLWYSISSWLMQFKLSIWSFSYKANATRPGDAENC